MLKRLNQMTGIRRAWVIRGSVREMSPVRPPELGLALRHPSLQDVKMPHFITVHALRRFPVQ